MQRNNMHVKEARENIQRSRHLSAGDSTSENNSQAEKNKISVRINHIKHFKTCTYSCILFYRDIERFFTQKYTNKIYKYCT